MYKSLPLTSLRHLGIIDMPKVSTDAYAIIVPSDIRDMIWNPKGGLQRLDPYQHGDLGEQYSTAAEDVEQLFDAAYFSENGILAAGSYKAELSGVRMKKLITIAKDPLHTTSALSLIELIGVVSDDFKFIPFYVKSRLLMENGTVSAHDVHGYHILGGSLRAAIALFEQFKAEDYNDVDSVWLYDMLAIIGEFSDAGMVNDDQDIFTTVSLCSVMRNVVPDESAKELADKISSGLILGLLFREDTPAAAMMDEVLIASNSEFFKPMKYIADKLEADNNIRLDKNLSIMAATPIKPDDDFRSSVTITGSKAFDLIRKLVRFVHDEFSCTLHLNSGELEIDYAYDILGMLSITAESTKSCKDVDVFNELFAEVIKSFSFNGFVLSRFPSTDIYGKDKRGVMIRSVDTSVLHVEGIVSSIHVRKNLAEEAVISICFGNETCNVFLDLTTLLLLYP